MSDEPRAAAPGQGGSAFGLSIGAFGMVLFLAALSMIFASTVLAYFYLRSAAPAWPPPDSPPLPRGLWLSTGLLLLVSGAAQAAVRSARRGRQGALRAALLATGVLAVAFLANQAFNWQAVHAVLVPPESKALAYRSIYYILTGTHALHVVGGLVVLAGVTWKAFRGAYSAAHHPGVRYTAVYWHFLDAVWLILLAVLMV